MSDKLDLVIIGAGPAGLACGIEAKKRDWNFQIIDKGCVVNSVYNYPTNMVFFTTADLLEIGGIPMTVSEPKPRRQDALNYYRRVVDLFELPIRDYEEVFEVEGHHGEFQVRTRDRLGQERVYPCAKIIVSTGYYDNPNMLDIPGEDLAKVSHYFSEPHPYYKKKVAVIGGQNSAAESALELYRQARADVTLIHRGSEVGKSIKYWVRPDINNRIERGEIRALFNSRVKEIRETEIVVETPEGRQVLENDYVLAMTGYHPNTGFLRSMGIDIDPETLAPSHDPQTLESNVKGIYVAGSIVAGKMTNKIFIENGRFHGGQIFQHMSEAVGDPA
ncbi:MAG TPA: YpdA family putative bacillithiol disulfide reductase [Acidobacteriota bacterium]|nr:YpdA family putative bacillithiol disulfide reductase [Acidobacteriota bacterium]